MKKMEEKNAQAKTNKQTTHTHTHKSTKKRVLHFCPCDTSVTG